MESHGPDDFVLTKHAEQMLGERRIEMDWVAATLRWPYWTEPDKSDRTCAMPCERLPSATERSCEWYMIRP